MLHVIHKHNSSGRKAISKIIITTGSKLKNTITPITIQTVGGAPYDWLSPAIVTEFNDVAVLPVDDVPVLVVLVLLLEVVPVVVVELGVVVPVVVPEEEELPAELVPVDDVLPDVVPVFAVVPLDVPELAELPLVVP